MDFKASLTSVKNNPQIRHSRCSIVIVASIHENFICNFSVLEPFAKILSRKNSPLYGMQCNAISIRWKTKTLMNRMDIHSCQWEIKCLCHGHPLKKTRATASLLDRRLHVDYVHQTLYVFTYGPYPSMILHVIKLGEFNCLQIYSIFL